MSFVISIPIPIPVPMRRFTNGLLWTHSDGCTKSDKYFLFIKGDKYLFFIRVDAVNVLLKLKYL